MQRAERARVVGPLQLDAEGVIEPDEGRVVPLVDHTQGDIDARGAAVVREIERVRIHPDHRVLLEQRHPMARAEAPRRREAGDPPADDRDIESGTHQLE
jgi:hypothetical protein